jgi:hypothetical protein
MIPRRNDILRMTPAELAIREARAVTLLGKAQNDVAIKKCPKCHGEQLVEEDGKHFLCDGCNGTGLGV